MGTQGQLRIIYALAVILMIIRVDIWWWGETQPLDVFGWLNAPMLYQLGIWLVGWMLVIYVARFIWTEEDE